VALGLTNGIVNRGGPPMAVRLAGETRRTTSDVAYAFMAAREVFALPRLWQRIDALDAKAEGEAQLELYQVTRRLANEQTQWFLRDGAAIADLAGTIARHAAGLAALSDALDGVLPPRRKAALEEAARRLAEGGVPADLAADVARLDVLAHAPAITEIAHATGRTVPEAAGVFLGLGERLRIAELAAKGQAIDTSDRFDRLAIAQAVGQLRAAQASFSRDAIGAGGAEAWLAAIGDRLARVTGLLEDAAGAGSLTPSRLSVAAGLLSDLAGAAPSAAARTGRTAGRARSAASGSRPLVSARRGLVPDRHHRGAGDRKRGGEHFGGQQFERNVAQAFAAMLCRGDEQVDVPGAGRDLRRPLLGPHADLHRVGIADGGAVALDDARQRRCAPHRQRDAGLRAGGAAPPFLRCRLGQPAANEKAILGRRRAEVDARGQAVGQV
jgi:hypothetical protein